jgi:hypothetical protein
MKKLITTSIVVAAIATAWPAAAQDSQAPAAQAPAAAQVVVEQAPAAPKPINMADMRHHIYVMEGALARAVDYGAKQLNREITAAMPGAFMLEGDATARGVHLEGYGVFFDVRVPMMRQSMMWSWRVLQEQNDAAQQVTIEELRRSLQGVTDPNTRASILRAINNLERQSGAPRPQQAAQQPVAAGMVMPNADVPGVGAGAAAGVGVNTVRPATPPPANSTWAKDPDRAYTEAVTRALVDAMIDYSTPMTLPAEQWLTVAARGDEGRDSLAPQDPLEELVTWIYRIKGSDLQLYRTGKIDRDEVRKRVQVSQF